MDSPAEVQSVYDFTVKVPTATLSFFYSSWKFGMCKALRFADHYHFILTSSMWKKNLQWYFIIFSWAVFFVTGHQWEWCFSECIQGQGSAHCQCCISMVIRSFPPQWFASSLQFAPWTVSPPHMCMASIFITDIWCWGSSLYHKLQAFHVNKEYYASTFAWRYACLGAMFTFFPPPHTFEVETVVSIQDGPCVISFDSWVFIIFLMIVGLQLVHDIWGLLGFGWMSEVGLHKPTTKSSQICTTSTKGVVSLRSSLSIWNGIVPGSARQCSCIKPCLSSSILKKTWWITSQCVLLL